MEGGDREESKENKEVQYVMNSILYNKCSILNDERTIDWVYPISSV